MLVDVFGDGSALMLAVLVFLATAIAELSASWRRCGCAAPSSGAPPASRRCPASGAVRGARSLRASEHQGGAAAARIHHQALRRDRRRATQGAAPAPDAGRHLRSARGRLLLPRAAGAGGGAGARRLRSRSDAASISSPLGVLAGGAGRRDRSAMSGRASISTGASSRGATSIAPAFRISWTCWWCARIPA